MKTSLRNTARNVDEVFELIQLGLNHRMKYIAITNLNDVVPLLSPDLEKYWIPNKNYFQVESLKVLPGILLWCSYATMNIPILGYGFQPHVLHESLEKALCQIPSGHKYLDSHEAISILSTAGAQVFLSTSNMHPLPDSEVLDDIFANHIGEILGLEAYSFHFAPRHNLFYHDYAAYNQLYISGGDNYCCEYPAKMFGKIQLPESPQSIWLNM